VPLAHAPAVLTHVSCDRCALWELPSGACHCRVALELRSRALATCDVLLTTGRAPYPGICAKDLIRDSNRLCVNPGGATAAYFTSSQARFRSCNACHACHAASTSYAVF
jgi:hypothetical protein